MHFSTLRQNTNIVGTRLGLHTVRFGPVKGGYLTTI